MNAADEIVQNMDKVLHALSQACQRRTCQADTPELMAVTKYAKDEDVLALLADGRIKHIGESRVQQAVKRWTSPEFAKYTVCKHFIGHLQKNKAALAASFFDFIDSIDDLETAQLLSYHAHKIDKVLHVLVQIKLTNNPAQSGISIAQAPSLVEAIKQLPNLNVCGYMAIAPRTENPEELRALFRQVKEAFERDFPSSLSHRYLSLGMSGDFEIAVEEGSTLPRVGSKLFARHLEEL